MSVTFVAAPSVFGDWTSRQEAVGHRRSCHWLRFASRYVQFRLPHQNTAVVGAAVQRLSWNTRVKKYFKWCSLVFGLHWNQVKVSSTSCIITLPSLEKTRFRTVWSWPLWHGQRAREKWESIAEILQSYIRMKMRDWDVFLSKNDLERVLMLEENDGMVGWSIFIFIRLRVDTLLKKTYYFRCRCNRSPCCNGRAKCCA